jgi:lipoate-protein ligase A
LVLDGAVGAHANLALEEAMLKENRGLVVRVWENEMSIILGRGQWARYETDVEYCAKEGIPVVRRMSAGGAVYNGPGNVNWSVFVGAGFMAGGMRYVRGARELFRMAAAPIVQASSSCGVKTWLDEPNRILSEAGKVSGMAAYISREGLFCHGTFLLSADLELARMLTEPAETKLDRKYTRSRPMKMANTGIELPSFIAAVRGAVAEQVGKELEIDQLRPEEVRTRDALMEKYRSAEWNLGDPFGV